MFTLLTLSAILASCILPAVHADPVPLTPGPGDVFREGGDCTFTWTPDPTGTWNVMNIELMTGSNFAMVHLDTVATVDGTSAAETSFTYPCPAVVPNSAIYFYQFSSPASTNRTWTTRFTITDPSGASTPPTEETQPGGAEIPWGTGALEDPASGRPAPAGGGGSGNVTGTSIASTTSAVPTTTPLQTPRFTQSSRPPTTTSAATAAAAATSTSAAAVSGLGAAAAQQAVRALVALASTAVVFVMVAPV